LKGRKRGGRGLNGRKRWKDLSIERKTETPIKRECGRPSYRASEKFEGWRGGTIFISGIKENEEGKLGARSRNRGLKDHVGRQEEDKVQLPGEDPKSGKRGKKSIKSKWQCTQSRKVKNRMK